MSKYLGQMTFSKLGVKTLPDKIAESFVSESTNINKHKQKLK